ncbi:MAG: hypothetical protein ACXQS8_00045 [Candidatus Helarchaeales archaeon]
MALEFKKRFLLYWNNLKFRVKVLKNIHVCSGDGTQLQQLPAKTETDIEFWKIKQFLEDDSIEILNPKPYVIADLDRILWKEEQNTELQKLDQHFYLLTNHLIKKLLKEENKKRLEDFDKGRELKLLVDNILERRLYKILKMVTIKEGERFAKNLTLEERILFDAFYSHYDTWKRDVCSFTIE